MDNPYEIHVLNSQYDLDNLQADARIPNDAKILLMKDDKVHELIDGFQAALSSNPELIALIVR